MVRPRPPAEPGPQARAAHDLPRLVCSDALELAASLPHESIDLIYVDPPFFSGREQRGTRHRGREQVSYADRWAGDLPAYLDIYRSF